MKNFFIFLMTVFSAAAFAQTPVNGNQSGSWSLPGSPYQVTGDIVVPAGESLTIEPGVEVNFQGHFKFTVNGTLLAAGTETDSIFFTTDDPATGWHGIRMTNSQNGSHLKYCRMEYGKTTGSNYPDQHGGAVMMNNCDAVIENCLFANNDASAEDNGMGGAIYGINTTDETIIDNCLFINNHSYGEGGAIKLTGDNGVHIVNCTFIDNSVLYGGGAVCLYGCYDTYIARSVFQGNVTAYSSGGAVFIEGYSARVIFLNCVMYDNHATGGDGGAVDIAFSDASFTNSIIYSNPGAYSDNIYLDFGYAEINYCDTPFPDGAEGENNININPQFVDAAAGDFHLNETSPCIDAGIDSLTITTAFGEEITVVDMDSSEYVGSAPDIGRYEYDPSTGFDISKDIAINVFPNPTNGIIYLNNDGENELKSIMISNLKGNVLIHKIVTSNPGQLDISGFENGVYILTVELTNGVLTRKIIKE